MLAQAGTVVGGLARSCYLFERSGTISAHSHISYPVSVVSDGKNQRATHHLRESPPHATAPCPGLAGSRVELAEEAIMSFKEADTHEF